MVTGPSDDRKPPAGIAARRGSVARHLQVTAAVAAISRSDAEAATRQDLAVLKADKWPNGASGAGGAVPLNQFLDWITRQAVASKKTTFTIVTNRSILIGKLPALLVALAVPVRFQPGFAETQVFEQCATPLGKEIPTPEAPLADGTPTGKKLPGTAAKP